MVSVYVFASVWESVTQILSCIVCQLFFSSINIFMRILAGLKIEQLCRFLF